MLTPDELLGPNGRLAARLAGWESRPQQLEMARLVGEAIRTRRHAVVEAGTGTGKSLAYLVPAVLAATADQVEPVRTGGSTGGAGSGQAADDWDDEPQAAAGHPARPAAFRRPFPAPPRAVARAARTAPPASPPPPSSHAGQPDTHRLRCALMLKERFCAFE